MNQGLSRSDAASNAQTDGSCDEEGGSRMSAPFILASFGCDGIERQILVQPIDKGTRISVRTFHPNGAPLISDLHLSPEALTLLIRALGSIDVAAEQEAA